MINFIAKIRLNDHPNNQKISIYKKLYSKDIEVEVLKYSDNLVEIHHTGTKDNLFIKYSCKVLHNEDELEKKSGIVEIGFPVVNTDWKEDGISHLLCQLMGGQMAIDNITKC